MTIEGAMDADVFSAHVEQVLEPTLRPGDMVVMDNLSAQTAGIRERLERCGAQLISWPPYTPDLAPIERCWSKLKTYLRKAQARTREALDTAMREALATIAVADAHRWFIHCGYVLQ